MNPYTLAFVAIRLIAIYLVANYLVFVPTFLTSMIGSGFRGMLDPGVFFGSVLTLFPLAIAVLLWIYTDKLASRVIGKARITEERPVSIHTFQAVAISTAGLLILVASVPQLISLLISYERLTDLAEGSMRVSGNVIGGLVSAGLRVLFGIILIVGTDKLTRLLGRFRQLGLEDKSD